VSGVMAVGRSGRELGVAPKIVSGLTLLAIGALVGTAIMAGRGRIGWTATIACAAATGVLCGVGLCALQRHRRSVEEATSTGEEMAEGSRPRPIDPAVMEQPHTMKEIRALANHSGVMGVMYRRQDATGEPFEQGVEPRVLDWSSLVYTFHTAQVAGNQCLIRDGGTDGYFLIKEIDQQGTTIRAHWGDAIQKEFKMGIDPALLMVSC
jgi:hypothetical protein